MTDENIQYLTSDGMKKIQDEYSELKDNKIPDIARQIDEAKQQGDLSENAEYQQAKEEMAWAQGRLKELEYILNNAKIINNTSLGDNKLVIIKIGSTVKFINIKTKQEKVFTIVGAQEADPQNNLISNESPLGQAFIGKIIGDKIKVKTPAGEQEYEIITIS